MRRRTVFLFLLAAAAFAAAQAAGSSARPGGERELAARITGIAADAARTDPPSR